MTLFYKTVCFLFYTYYRLFHRFQIEGLENVPEEGAFLLASNHLSFFDPPALGCRLPRNLHYFARDSLFKGLLGMFIRSLNSIPVNRSQLDLATLRRVLKVLKDGHPLLVFPEGTRSEDGSLREGKKGVGMLVAKSQVPVLPARVFGSYEILGKGKSVPRIGRKLRLVYGPLLKFDEIDPGGKGGERYEKISQSVMAAISEIK
jgi:1-acyl-sn-glycerol-3-phosphate acyltransferase